MSPGPARDELAALCTVVCNPRRVFAPLPDAFLKAHHDCFLLAVGGRAGAVRLSEWWACWSVKWHSLTDEIAPFVFVDGVGEVLARAKFAELRALLEGRSVWPVDDKSSCGETGVSPPLGQ